jgi:hypothetical protein
MSLFRKLSIASICLTIIGQVAGWGGEDGTAETSAEIAMLVKAFGGGAASPPDADKDGRQRGGAAADPSDPAALLSALLH